MTEVERKTASIREQFRYAKGVCELKEVRKRLVSLMRENKNNSVLVDLLNTMNAVIDNEIENEKRFYHIEH